MEYVPCIGNSSYSFWWILLKLYRCFKDGLEICILFFQNPEIIFYHFFRIFNLDIFRALILQICIWSIYLVSATPPTVFGESFWNFTVVFRMVWRYAYCFLRILKLFFLHFNLDIFQAFLLQICIGSICLVSATPPTVLGQSFWNFTGTLQLSFDFTWEICHLLDITAVAGHFAWLVVLFSVAIDKIHFKCVGNENIHNISDEFEFWPDRTTDYGVNCPWTSKKYPHRIIMGKMVSPLFLGCLWSVPLHTCR